MNHGLRVEEKERRTEWVGKRDEWFYLIKFETHVIALFIPKEGDGRISIHVCEREGLKEMAKGEKERENGRERENGNEIEWQKEERDDGQRPLLPSCDFIRFRWRKSCWWYVWLWVCNVSKNWERREKESVKREWERGEYERNGEGRGYISYHLHPHHVTCPGRKNTSIIRKFSFLSVFSFSQVNQESLTSFLPLILTKNFLWERTWLQFRHKLLHHHQWQVLLQRKTEKEGKK